eukprot:TRINITY_DN9112_c0_g1_i3.p1 TRINITY_DN9112_c0_g1~~TRINITY_DN9112_c0_g1_i3.p1  ORF type:complete len:105 (-),score=22.78 TRINITY_DN9112_c0_g1_i3:356-670(-)
MEATIARMPPAQRPLSEYMEKHRWPLLHADAAQAAAARPAGVQSATVQGRSRGRARTPPQGTKSEPDSPIASTCPPGQQQEAADPLSPEASSFAHARAQVARKP